MPAPPLFILGTERSGSNLLRVILDSHPRIVIPHPPHVMRYFTPLAPRYGDLADASNLAALVDDVLALVHAHIHPWPWIPSATDLLGRLQPAPGASAAITGPFGPVMAVYSRRALAFEPSRVFVTSLDPSTPAQVPASAIAADRVEGTLRAGHEVARSTWPPDLYAIYAALHEALRDHDLGPDGGRWGCKSTFMIDHVERIVASEPDARLIWLYRDPRDVAASSRESVFSAFHPWKTAQLWARQQERGLALEKAGYALFRLPYEDLVARPEAEVRRLCAYIGEEFHPPMLEFFRGKEAKLSSTLSESWKNTAAPIRGEGLQRWRKDLSGEEVLAVEAVAGAAMTALGYELTCSAADRSRAPSVAERVRWTAEDEAAWLRVEWRSLRKDKNVGLRWKRWLLLQKIRATLTVRGR